MHHLTYPAPRRTSDCTGHRPTVREVWKTTPVKGKTLTWELGLQTVTVEQPLFVTRPWEEHDVMRVLANGGWFDFATAEFADRKTREFALSTQMTHSQLIGE